MALWQQSAAVDPGDLLRFDNGDYFVTAKWDAEKVYLDWNLFRRDAAGQIVPLGSLWHQMLPDGQYRDEQIRVALGMAGQRIAALSGR